ncbi:MAG: L-fucose:H+ symporter permease [Terracidiphilus sp.]|jgi:FHS family L-fucose permease-like MFS transporter
MQTSPAGVPNPREKKGSEELRVFPTQHRLIFALVTILFFLWGMSNNLTDILVQQFRKSFELSPLQAQLVQTAVFLGYFFMAIPAAVFMRRLGYKAGILAGLCLFGGGMLMFWPAAIVGQYSLFLVALFMVGCGSATLETAANPFIAQFGPSETSEQRLNFSQAFNPLGTITGVLIGTYFILSGIELSMSKVAKMKSSGRYAAYLHSEIFRVVPTYVILGCIVLAWAVWIGVTKFPQVGSIRSSNEDQGSFRQLLCHRNLWLAVIAQFCYCGAQVSTWSAFIPYVKQYTSFTERTAGLYLTGSLAAMALGRFSSTSLMNWIPPTRMIGAFALMNIALLSVGILHPGPVGVWTILSTSFFMSIMFPTIFALGVKGLGVNTKIGGSVIVMSVVGAAIIPPALGWIANRTGSYAMGYTVTLAAYIVVALYGFLGGARGESGANPPPTGAV